MSRLWEPGEDDMPMRQPKQPEHEPPRPRPADAALLARVRDLLMTLRRDRSCS